MAEMTGAQLRDQAVAEVIAADHAPHREYGRLVEDAIRQLAQSGTAFTADDIRAQLPADVVERMSPYLPGSCLRVASVRGEIEHVGWVTSCRAIRHRGAIRRWRGTTAGERRAS